MLPSSDVLIQLSKVLEMKLDYFFRPFTVAIDTSKFEFRKKSSMGASLPYPLFEKVTKGNLTLHDVGMSPFFQSLGSKHR